MIIIEQVSCCKHSEKDNFIILKNAVVLLYRLHFLCAQHGRTLMGESP